MTGQGAAVRVGLLVLGATALLVALVMFLTGTGVVSGVRYESYFGESVQGLDVGTPVKLRGVSVGQVTEIGLASAEYGHGAAPDADGAYRLVLVRWIVNRARMGNAPNSAEAIRTGLRVRLAPQGLTGGSYLEMDYVAPGSAPPLSVPWTPRAQYVPAVPSTLGQVTSAATDLLHKLDQVDVAAMARELAGLAGDLRGEIRDGDVHQVLTQAVSLLADLHDTLRAADLPALAASLRDTSGAVRGLATGRQAHDLLANAGAAADRFARVANELPPLIASLQAVAGRADAGTADLQAALAPVLRDAHVAVQNLRETTESLRRDPGQVLLAAPPPRVMAR